MLKILWGILLLAFLLRVPFLDSYPIGFTPDEASFGYDAYSILKTGRDQWGHPMPLVLESFGDFKAPLYTYLDIPFVAIFGLTKEATRLPNALFGVAAVWVVYLLTKELMVKRSENTDRREIVALLAAFLLAISPWHIQLSRGAFEANLTVFFLPLGALFFMRGLRDQKYFIYAALAFGLNLFSYHSAKVVTPLVAGFMFLIFWKQMLKMFKKSHVLLAGAIFSVFLIFTAVTFFQGAGRRVSDVSIFNGALEAQADQRLAAINSGMSPTTARLLHNKYYVIADRFKDNYLSYFSFDYLFVNGPREATYGMMPEVGVLYWFELPMILAFVWYLLKNRKEKYFWIVAFYVLVSPIPASLTMGVGHAGNRAATMLPAIQIASAIGAVYFFEQMKNKSFKYAKPMFIVFTFIVTVSLLGFLKNYFLLSPYVLGKSMLVGNMEAAYWLSENSSDSSKVLVSNKLSEPHIYIAFTHKWDPVDYQKSSKDWNRYKDEGLKFLDQLYSYNLGKYQFKRLEVEDLSGISENYIVGRYEEFPDTLEVVKTFEYPDDSTSVMIVKPYKDLYAKSL